MESTLTVLSQFSTSKEGIEDFAQKTITEVQSGNINPLQLKVMLKSISEAIEKIDKGTKYLQLTEAEKYGQKTFEALGAKIEISELGVKYDFTNCQDQVWNELQIKLAALNTLIKERENFLKSIKNSLNVVTDDGEAVTVYAPVKSSSTGLKIFIK